MSNFVLSEIPLPSNICNIKILEPYTQSLIKYPDPKTIPVPEKLCKSSFLHVKLSEKKLKLNKKNDKLNKIYNISCENKNFDLLNFLLKIYWNEEINNQILKVKNHNLSKSSFEYYNSTNITQLSNNTKLIETNNINNFDLSAKPIYKISPNLSINNWYNNWYFSIYLENKLRVQQLYQTCLKNNLTPYLIYPKIFKNSFNPHLWFRSKEIGVEPEQFYPYPIDWMPNPIYYGNYIVYLCQKPTKKIQKNVSEVQNKEIVKANETNLIIDNNNVVETKLNNSSFQCLSTVPDKIIFIKKFPNKIPNITLF